MAQSSYAASSSAQAVSAPRPFAGGQPALFLAWAKPSHTRRSVLMARRLGIPLRRVHVLRKNPVLAPLRYPAQAALTLATLFREQPKIVFVQNPPIFAPLCVWLYCALTGGRFIIDSHTSALQSPYWDWALPLHAFVSRRALTTLVTNETLRQKVRRWNAPSHIVIDVPSDLPAGRPFPLERDFNVAMVSTYAPDEPLEAVVAAARSLPEVGFYITGDPKQSLRPVPADLPANVFLTGYMPDDDFYGLLRSVQAVMALTTWDNTMQRAACEAVWLGRPIITSDWPLLRQAFHRGTLHVDNTAASIRQAVLAMRQRHVELAADVQRLQDERHQLWAAAVTTLEALIDGQAQSGRAGRSGRE